MKISFLCTSIALLLVPLEVLAEQSEMTFRVVADSWLYSDSYTTDQLLNSMGGGSEPERGHSTLGKLKYGVELTYNQHTAAMHRRREILIGYTQDTVDFLYADKNNLDLVDGREYRLSLDYFSVEFTEYQYRFNWRINENLTIEPGFSILYGEEMVDAKLTGKLGTDHTFAGIDYAWDVALNYFYNKDTLLERENVIPETARGYSFYLGIDWQLSDKYQLTMAFNDLYSLLKWKRAPHTGAISVVNDSIGPHDAAIHGNEGYKTLKQKLPMHTQINLAYNHSDDFKLLLGVEHIKHNVFYFIGDVCVY